MGVLFTWQIGRDLLFEKPTKSNSAIVASLNSCPVIYDLSAGVSHFTSPIGPSPNAVLARNRRCQLVER